MKDGRTHLAHKAEHAVDLGTGAIVGVTVQDADEGDTTTSRETLIDAAKRIEAVRPESDASKRSWATRGITATNRSWISKPWGVRSYLRTRSGTTKLEKEPRRPRCRVPQSSTHPWPAWPTSAATPR